jgi:hypothetical protein
MGLSYSAILARPLWVEQVPGNKRPTALTVSGESAPFGAQHDGSVGEKEEFLGCGVERATGVGEGIGEVV